MTPEIKTFPDDQRVFGLTLYEGEPSIIGHGTFYQNFSAVMLVLDLRARMIERNPEKKEEIVETKGKGQLVYLPKSECLWKWLKNWLKL